jgi:branched-subunit amino acid aminotransferase/4-amino-4-deoxychorismate lyase
MISLRGREAGGARIGAAITLADVSALFAQLLEVDGHPATVEQVWAIDMSSGGHFTAMQVRGGATLGLEFHLARLDSATRELFGAGLDGDLVRGDIRHALGGVPDASVRVNVFRPSAAESSGQVSVMVSVRPPAAAPGRPQRLQTVEYQRPMAHIKHATGFGQNYFAGLAGGNGFDEALFVTPGGAVCEGSITNIGFVDGDAIVWPDAPALRGVMMLVLQRELTRAGAPWRHGPVRAADLASFGGALVTNSHGMAAVASIDDVSLPTGAAPLQAAADLLAAAPYDPI